VPTCLAVLVLRRKRGPSSFQLPGGWLIPVLATVSCGLFIVEIGKSDAIFSLWTLVVGLGLHAAWRMFRPAPTTA
jgi:hypothetical protein